MAPELNLFGDRIKKTEIPGSFTHYVFTPELPACGSDEKTLKKDIASAAQALNLTPNEVRAKLEAGETIKW